MGIISLFLLWHRFNLKSQIKIAQKHFKWKSVQAFHWWHWSQFFVCVRNLYRHIIHTRISMIFIVFFLLQNLRTEFLYNNFFYAKHLVLRWLHDFDVSGQWKNFLHWIKKLFGMVVFENKTLSRQNHSIFQQILMASAFRLSDGFLHWHQWFRECVVGH